MSHNFKLIPKSGMVPIRPDSLKSHHSLVFALKRDTGNALRVWDDGFGPCWLISEPFGYGYICKGVVRATSFEAAHECAVDEILDDASEFDMMEACRKEGIATDENGIPVYTPEGYYWRGGTPSADYGLSSLVAQADPGWHIVELSDDVADRHNIEIFIDPETAWEDDDGEES